MKSIKIQRGWVGGMLTAGLLALPAAAWSQAAGAASGQSATQTVNFNVPAQPLREAVLSFARQAGVDLYIGNADLAPYRSVAVQGEYTIVGALTRLLGGSPVAYRYRDAGPGGRLNVQLFSNEEDSRSGVMELSTVVVEGTAPGEWVYQAPRAVSVITREAMDRTPARHAADLLQDTPGVTSAVSRQNPGLSVNIRGMQDFGRVNMMIDGMRQNFVQSGHMQRNGEMYVDSELLSEVLVERGVHGDVHSTGAMAGSVDFRSLDFADLLREGRDYGVRLRGSTGLGGEGNGIHFLGSAAGAARVGEVEVLAAYSRKSIGDYTIGKRGGDNMNSGWVDGGLTQFNDVKYASQSQNTNMFKARWNLGTDQSLQLSYIGTRISYANVTDSNLTLQDSGTPWRSLGDSSITSNSFALDYQINPADNNWLDLKLKLYTVDTRNRNYTAPTYPRVLGTLTDAQQIRDWVDMRWDQGHCEKDPIPADAQAACNYALGIDNRIKTETHGLQLDNTSRFNLGQATLLSANYGIEYFQDRATSRVVMDHDGREIERYNPYGQGDTLNPRGKRQMANIFTRLTLEDDFYTVSAGLRYERYWLKGTTQVPGTRSTYLNRFEKWLSYFCSGTTVTRIEGCNIGRNQGEAAAIAWTESKDPRRGYWNNPQYAPEWRQENGLYESEVDRSEGKLLPSLSLAIRPTNWLELYTSWGKSWRPPAINETLMVGSHPGDSASFMYPNPNADPETSRTWEIGANTIFRDVLADGDRLMMKLGYFDTRANNYLFSSIVNNLPGSNQSQLFGLGRMAFVNNRTQMRFRGLEFEGHYDAGWIYGGLSYTHYIGGPNKFCQDLYFAGAGDSALDQQREDGSYSEQHNQAVSQGYASWQDWANNQVVCGNFAFNSAVAKPVDKGAAVLGVRLFQRKLDTGVRVSYSGPGWYNRDSGGSQVWFRYTTLDWYASYQATENVKILASVENVTDRAYRDGYSDALARTYAPGRTVIVGMELTF